MWQKLYLIQLSYLPENVSSKVDISTTRHSLILHFKLDNGPHLSKDHRAEELSFLTTTV